MPSSNIEVEIGKVAKQASGAAWFKYGGTVILATVTEEGTKEFPGFLPLTVDYREQFSAAGKIPGGYFRREGKPRDEEILTGRLIDRAIRPLFPETYFNNVQVIATVYSVDKEHMPGTVSLLASSIALAVSPIPFLGPVGAVEVARVDGEWIFMPTYKQALASDVRLVVAGTYEGINMVEGAMQEVSEQDLVTVFFQAHEKIKAQIDWQKEIQRELGIVKADLKENDEWSRIRDKAQAFLTSERLSTIFDPVKKVRSERLAQLKESFLEQEQAEINDNGISEKFVDYLFDKVFAEEITKEIFKQNKRIDGRAFNEIRPISVEVGLLPYTHGSALFTRGKTQALASATLEGGKDQQIEDLMGNTIEKPFMLHYNFLPFSGGDVRPLRGPGRREIGHGYIGETSLEQVLPAKKDFPYTIRVTDDILESDGSTSMASTCAATMALMNAGVPIRKMVSGIAMGLLQRPDKEFQALSDINGSEDAYGLMDFKVTGTDDGVTAIQMDIKYKGGLPKEVFQKAFEQARHGRLHILSEMQKVMSAPSATLSPLVPQIISVKIPVDKIGAIIGTGGKVIKDITEKTGTTIDIESDGTVNIYGQPDSNTDMAVKIVKTLAGLIETGAIYTGKVKRITDFGIFVEIAPGQDGLVHISAIPREKQPHLTKEYPPDKEVLVEVTGYDQATGRIRLRFVESAVEHKGS